MRYLHVVALRMLSQIQQIDGNIVSINKALRVLHLEDEPDFSALVRTLLEREGFQVDLVLVDNLADFQKALASEPFDAVLSFGDLILAVGLCDVAFHASRRPKPRRARALPAGDGGGAAGPEPEPIPLSPAHNEPNLPLAPIAQK